MIRSLFEACLTKIQVSVQDILTKYLLQFICGYTALKSLFMINFLPKILKTLPNVFVMHMK